MGVAKNFKTFCDNLTIGTVKRSTISSRYKAITNRLNIEYWGDASDSLFSRYVGSYGRNTATDRISDVDMIFVLPQHYKSKYDAYIYNGQSSLLQDVRKSISKTYSNTKIGADGQVVQVDFYDGINFEVVPAFQNDDKSYIYPDSNNGGRWKTTNPHPEIDKVNASDPKYNYNLKRLCKMTRSWKDNCNVTIGGLLIDTLALKFLENWYHNQESYLYYDFMMRDFFKYLKNQNPDQTYWFALGSNQMIFRKGNFEYKAKLAYNKSLEAIDYQSNDKFWSANQKWREIFGTRFPL